jgi:hypothetical protein
MLSRRHVLTLEAMEINHISIAAQELRQIAEDSGNEGMREVASEMQDALQTFMQKRALLEKHAKHHAQDRCREQVRPLVKLAPMFKILSGADEAFVARESERIWRETGRRVDSREILRCRIRRLGAYYGYIPVFWELTKGFRRKAARLAQTGELSAMDTFRMQFAVAWCTLILALCPALRAFGIMASIKIARRAVVVATVHCVMPLLRHERLA